LLLLIKTKIRENLLKKKSIIAITSQAPSLAQLMGNTLPRGGGETKIERPTRYSFKISKKSECPKNYFSIR
jgi:hypothetical protein